MAYQTLTLDPLWWNPGELLDFDLDGDPYFSDWNNHQNDNLTFDTLDDLNLSTVFCSNCERALDIFHVCDPFSEDYWHAHLPDRTDNESGATQRSEMESSTQAGVTTTSTTTLPQDNNFLTVDPTAVTSAPGGFGMAATALGSSLMQTPGSARYNDPTHAYYLQDSMHDGANAFAADGNQSPPLAAPDSADRNAANTLGALNIAAGSSFFDADRSLAYEQLGNAPAEPVNGSLDSLTASGSGPRETWGFARLMFPDGDYVVQATDVILGRDEEIYRQVMQEKKQSNQAAAALHSYKQEPSRTSQQGDGEIPANRSSSAQSQDGRPAVPSNVSESGGIVSFQADMDGEDYSQRRSTGKHRGLPVSKSSSAGSINPSQIFRGVVMDTDASGAASESEDRQVAFLPIHTSVRWDITKLSKQHLRFRYDFEEGSWLLQVLGRGAYVNDTYLQQGQNIYLQDMDEILISTLWIVFKLPDDAVSPESYELNDDDGVPAGTSPALRLSNVMEAASSDLDDDDDVETAGKPKSKSKAKLKKMKTESGAELSTETGKKVKKPKAAEKSSANIKKESPPPQIDPDSSLAHIPIEQRPTKRHGPGRPPKNGFLSKRDETAVEKMIKEYKKRGEDPPPYTEMLETVRKEAKLKDQLKAQNNGDADVGGVVRSIETDSGPNATKTTTGSTAQAAGPSNDSAEQKKRASPNPKKRKASESPIPPKESFSEEQLKRPNATYVVLINTILEEECNDKEADLPQLYKQIKKKWPYFQYCADTKGWESSVRHNLQGSPRFVRCGKSGKGAVWTIDPEQPIQENKKRPKLSPQPTRAQPNGQFVQSGQFGHAGFGSQQSNNANQGGYSSPYVGRQGQAGPSTAASEPSLFDPGFIGGFVRLRAAYVVGNTPSRTDPNRTREDVLFGEVLDGFSNAYASIQNLSSAEGIAAIEAVPVPVGLDQEKDSNMAKAMRELFIDRIKNDAKSQGPSQQPGGAGITSTVAAVPGQQANGGASMDQSIGGAQYHGPATAGVQMAQVNGAMPATFAPTTDMTAPASIPAVHTPPQPHINNTTPTMGAGAAHASAPQPDSPHESPAAIMMTEGASAGDTTMQDVKMA